MALSMFAGLFLLLIRQVGPDHYHHENAAAGCKKTMGCAGIT